MDEKHKDPINFLKTVYLGDRSCKSILLDGWNAVVALHVDEISRIRSKSGNWEYYNAENMTDGRIVFTGVQSIKFHPSGFIPNDAIVGIEAEPLASKGEKEASQYLFKITIMSVDASAKSTEVQIQIFATDIHLEDPGRPGIAIRE